MLDKLNMSRTDKKNHQQNLLRFLDAVLTNDITTARELIHSGLKPNSTFPKFPDRNSCQYVSLLELARMYNRAEIMDMLIEAEANLDVHNSDGNQYGQKLLRFHDAILNNNAEAARDLLAAGLSPNSTFPQYSCPKSCQNVSPLYLACVHGRMEIVQMLLEAGADPDRQFTSHHIHLTNSAFAYAMANRSQELMSLLLRENKASSASSSYVSGSGWLHYGSLRHFHDDMEVINILFHRFGSMGRILEGLDLHRLVKIAARYRCSKLSTFLLNYCGENDVVQAILDSVYFPKFGTFDDESQSLTLSYFMDTHRIKSPVEKQLFRQQFLKTGFDVLELLMSHLYQTYGDDKSWWRQQMTAQGCSDVTPGFISYMHGSSYDAYGSPRTRSCRFACFLSWGMYSVLCDVTEIPSLFYTLVQLKRMECASMLVSLYPQCLQEQWLVSGRKPWAEGINFDWYYFPHQAQPDNEAQFSAFVTQRRHAPTLEVVCRSFIFHELGINPIAKAEDLPLPRILKDFIQCKDIRGVDSNDI